MNLIITNLINSKSLLCCFVYLFTSHFVLSDPILAANLHQSPQGQSTNDDFVLNSWKSLRNQVNWDVNTLTSGVFANLNQIIKSSNVSQLCDQSLHSLMEDAKSKKTWAIKALTSWGKFPPSGLLSGTSTSFGAYDQCLSMSITKYCTIYLRPILPKRPKYHKIIDKLDIFNNQTLDLDNAIDYLYDKAHFYYYIPIRIGICIPHTCTDDEVDQMSFAVGKMIHLKGEATKCESQQSIEVKFNFQEKIALSLLMMFLWTALIATIIDVYHQKEESFKKYPKLMCFSLINNLRQFYQATSPKHEIKCLNGIRCLTMFWIILGHSAVYINHQTFSNSYKVIDLITPFSSQAILNMSYSVDTFFVISGLLTSYVAWKSYLISKVKFDPIWFIVSRYIRLTPALLASICVLLLLPKMASGPLWGEQMDTLVEPCRKYWWTNLLYIQSFVNPDSLCSIPTWWLSSDMFFHVISIALMILYFKSSIIAIMANFGIIFAFKIATIIKRMDSNLDPTVVPTAVQIDDYQIDNLSRFLWLPYLHGPPFFIGLFVGYFLAKHSHLKLGKKFILLAWFVNLSLIFLVLHISYPLTLGHSWPTIVGHIFSLTSRTIWATCIAWIVFACYYGYGGWINTFLGHKFFTPFAKISYCVYLTHMLFIYIFMGTRRELQNVSMYDCIYLLIPHWFSAQIFGFVCHILFELPFLNLTSYLSKRRRIMINEIRDVNGRNGVDSHHDRSKEQKIDLL